MLSAGEIRIPKVYFQQDGSAGAAESAKKSDDTPTVENKCKIDGLDVPMWACQMGKDEYIGMSKQKTPKDALRKATIDAQLSIVLQECGSLDGGTASVHVQNIFSHKEKKMSGEYHFAVIQAKLKKVTCK